MPYIDTQLTHSLFNENVDGAIKSDLCTVTYKAAWTQIERRDDNKDDDKKVNQGFMVFLAIILPIFAILYFASNYLRGFAYSVYSWGIRRTTSSNNSTNVSNISNEGPITPKSINNTPDNQNKCKLTSQTSLDTTSKKESGSQIPFASNENDNKNDSCLPPYEHTNPFATPYDSSSCYGYSIEMKEQDLSVAKDINISTEGSSKTHLTFGLPLKETQSDSNISIDSQVEEKDYTLSSSTCLSEGVYNESPLLSSSESSPPIIPSNSF